MTACGLWHSQEGHQLRTLLIFDLATKSAYVHYRVFRFFDIFDLKMLGFSLDRILDTDL